MLPKKTRITGAVFGLFMLMGLTSVSHTVDAVQPDESIAELKKRVARLEAEVADLRKVLLRAGGQLDSATEIRNVSEVAKLRAAELLQRSKNAHSLLRDIHNGKFAGVERQNKINELNNDLTSLWLTMAGHGLGRDPYLDNITLSNSGFSRAKPSPSFGITGNYVELGLPRLHEKLLDASGIKGADAAKKNAEFKKLVQPYANPAVFQHREFSERAYSEYRRGVNVLTAQYIADLKALDQWFTDLETALEKVPTHFNKAQ